ncbi:MAG TPA: hypothetical protein VGK14_09025 [Novimethylophilus sp.]|jgi:Na+/H+-translocating membrane pyrophosphatase|uniref:hypothetical protein n=1 Tax=Novimethylophilus sp. TaxID=2137426 RepID=UPI002F3E53A0
MNTSDWIALAAACAAFIGLIPQFAQMTRTKSSKEKQPVAKATDAATEEPQGKSEPVKLNDFGKALVLTVCGLAIGVVEIVLFSTFANIYGIAISTVTMPTNWLIVFYALFVVPGVFLFMAFAHLSNLFE